MTQVCGTGTWGSAPKPGDPDNNSILTAKPAFGGIDVMWTFPEVNPHGVAYVNLYRGTSGEVAHAVRHAVVNGNFFYDKITTDTSIRYFYWIEIVSVNGTHGDLIGPASAIARPTIEQIMDDLTAQIDAGMLAQTLKQRLDRIELVDHRIAEEILERARSIATLGDSIALLQSEVDGAVSAIIEETTQRQDAHEAFVGQLNLMFASLDGSITAAIQSERQARVSADSAITESIDIMYATLGDDIEAAVLSERTARTDSQSAMATAFDALVAQTAEDINAAIQTESSVRSDAVEAVTSQLTILESRVNDDVFAAINTERQARTSGHEALSTEITTLGSKFEDDLSAAIQTEQTARSTAVDALASAIQTTQAELGNDIAIARTQLITMVDDTVGAMWTAQVDVNGMVGGFGIMNDGQQVEAGFNVNRFWVGKSDVIKRYPFIIENDEVFIDEAVINKLTFNKLRDTSGNVVVQNGKLQAKYIDADNLSVKESATFTGTAQSSNFRNNAEGWRLTPTGGQINFPIRFSSVTGAGALASKNSLSYSEVTGTKPPTNADRTASNTAYDTARVAGTDSETIRGVVEDTVLDPGFTRTVNGEGYWTLPSSGVTFPNRGDFGPCAYFYADNVTAIIQNTERGRVRNNRIGLKGGQSVSVSFTGYYGPRLSGSDSAYFRAGILFYDSNSNSMGTQWVSFWPENNDYVYSASNPDGPVKVGQLSNYSGVVTAPATAAYGVVRFQVRNCRFFLTHLDVDTRSAARTWIRPNSTLIDGNKIYTGDAYVDTLQIKGQAITVPSSSETPSSSEVTFMSRSTGGSWTAWQNLNTTNIHGGATGGVVWVFAHLGLIRLTNPHGGSTNRLEVELFVVETGERLRHETLTGLASGVSADYRSGFIRTFSVPANSTRTVRFRVRASAESGNEARATHQGPRFIGLLLGKR